MGGWADVTLQGVRARWGREDVYRSTGGCFWVCLDVVTNWGGEGMAPSTTACSERRWRKASHELRWKVGLGKKIGHVLQ